MNTTTTTSTATATTPELITVTRLPEAPEGTPASRILKGKAVATVIIGAIKRKGADGTERHYTGDLVLSAPLPSVAVSHYLPAGLLTQEQGAALDSILTQEQERKIRAKATSQSLNFLDSFSFQSSAYDLASTFTPERRGDGLNAESIKGLFASREYITASTTYYGANGISTAGAAKGESLIASVIRNTGSTTPEVWKKLAERFADIAASCTTFSEEQALTASNILARLLSAAEGKQDAAESID